MSDGAKLVAAILETGSTQFLRQIDRSMFEESEVALFDFVSQHFRRYGELPAIATVEAETRQRLPHPAEPVPYYVKRIYDRRLFLTLREGFGGLREALQGFDVDAAREIVERLASACRTSSPDSDLRNIREASEEVLRLYEHAHANPGMSGVPTGFPTLDVATGGYQNGDLVSWVARMGMGKSYVLIHKAKVARDAGNSVLFVTMEMTIAQIVRRLLAMDTGIAPDYIRKGTLSSYAQRRLRAYVSTIASADRLHFYSGAFSKKSSDVDLLMTELAPDITYVDGGYLINSDGVPKNASRIDKVAAVFGDLKRMTITHDRPIVVTTQFSRGAGKKGKDGSLETVAFSDAIAMNSSLVFGLKEGNPPHEKARRLIDTMKGREGEDAELEINFGFSPVNFGEVPPEQAQAEAVNTDWMG